MFIFGLVFLVYFLKLSVGNGFKIINTAKSVLQNNRYCIYTLTKMYFSEEKLMKYKPAISLLSYRNTLYAYMQQTPIFDGNNMCI